MIDGIELHARLLGLSEARGGEGRALRIGEGWIRIEGLDAGLAAELDLRWGGFLRSARPPADYTLRVFRERGSAGFLEARAAEPYRMEALNDASRRVIVSYNFALCAEADDPAAWRVALREGSTEPAGRILDNAARFFAARIAVDRGGFAMHAAGLAREGRAHILAGPSRAGKSTALALAVPDHSLGDDFALVVPGEGGWRAPALPFDNSERADRDPAPGLYPVAGIWRLHQADRVRIERLAPGLATASLMACTAFPWAIPELAERLLDHVRRYVREGGFAHLHFTRHDDLWPWIAGGAAPAGEGPEVAR